MHDFRQPGFIYTTILGGTLSLALMWMCLLTISCCGFQQKRKKKELSMSQETRVHVQTFKSRKAKS